MNLREITLVDFHLKLSSTGDLNNEMQMLEFLKQWLRIQNHTKDWVFTELQIPQPPGNFLGWGISVSRWMAPKDLRLRRLKYRLGIQEMTS
jgi:hypothetical protein